MIDEYQDTNFIQEQLIRLLGGCSQQIFVVGDDDQSIYRFRGASIGNILGFSKTYETCHTFKLDTNYRSHPGIVRFCMDWMRGLKSWRGADGRMFRYVKGDIHAASEETGTPVLCITGKDLSECHARIADFIEGLKERGQITDYNQVAVLCSSVKSNASRALQLQLRRKGIASYAPRAGWFFKRQEVEWLIGALLLLFPSFRIPWKSGRHAGNKGDSRYILRVHGRRADDARKTRAPSAERLAGPHAECHFL